MKSSLILLIFSFFLFPVSSFATTSADFELDCWHASNNSSITVDIQFNMPATGWETMVRLAPTESMIFDTIPQGYNPRVAMIASPFDTWWFAQDCRDGFRNVDPQWYTDYKNGGSGTGTTPTPVDITGYFSTPVSVASGAYNWNMTLNLSQSGHIDAIEDIQLWNAFHVDSATTSGDSIVLALSPNTAPLAVACGTYTVTVPASLIQGNDGVSANPQEIV